jgi:hypothetical protein
MEKQLDFLTRKNGVAQKSRSKVTVGTTTFKKFNDKSQQ